LAVIKTRVSCVRCISRFLYFGVRVETDSAEAPVSANTRTLRRSVPTWSA